MFPDDALVMIAGTLKMSLKWFIPSIVVCRGIGIATIIFGLGNIPFDQFTTPWHWIIFITLCAVGIIAVFWGANKLSIYLEKRGTLGSADAKKAENGEPVEVSAEEPTLENADEIDTVEPIENIVAESKSNTQAEE